MSLAWPAPTCVFAKADLNFCGAAIAVASNSPEVLQYAALSFAPGVGGTAELRIVVEVDATLPSVPPWPQPYFRGRDHIVVGTYSDDCAVVMDMHRRVAHARVSVAFARDRERWLHSVFPVIIGVMSAPLGITPLHAACVELQNGALLITGPSGAGKSTLSIALARLGLRLLSDDWTYLAPDGRELWGLPVPVKLMPDCTAFFPELRSLRTAMALNGEIGFEVEAERAFSIQRTFRTRAAGIVLLDRQAGFRGLDAARIAGNTAARELTAMLEDLPQEFNGGRERQLRAVNRLVSLPAWRITCGGPPQEIARCLIGWASREELLRA